MPWKEETIMSLKQEFIQCALTREQPFARLCQAFGITRKTGYTLLERYQQEGVAGLTPRSKRPRTSPHQTKTMIEEAIIACRRKEPTWGARKIIRSLQWQGVEKLPSATTVNTLLHRHGLILPTESLKRQRFIRFEREQPNELWQMDFKGAFRLLTNTICYPLTVLDDHSRFSLGIKACENEQCLSVKTRLTSIFEAYGLPDQINVDNGNPWGSSHLTPYTHLGVWLMQLGIRISHSRPGHPQTNGKCERFHRTLKQDLITRYPMQSFDHAQHLFDQWRERYNHERPHEAIGMEVPASRYQASCKPMPKKLVPVHYPTGATLKKVKSNGYISYDEKFYLVGEAFHGQLIEVRPCEQDNAIQLYFGQHNIYTYVT
jgi:transposase InsO family protein